MAIISIRADVNRAYGNTVTEVIYADLPTNLDVHPFSGDLTRLTNQHAIGASIRHLVMTISGQRPYSTVGSAVNYSVFQLFSIVQSQLLQNAIINVLNSYEPRVSVQNVVINEDANNNSIIINVQYVIINMPSQVFSSSIIIERNR